jgi:hypothetical protein
MTISGIRYNHEWNRAITINRAILIAYSKFKYSHELKIFLRAFIEINNT